MNVFDIPVQYLLTGFVLWLLLSAFFIWKSELIAAAVVAFFFFAEVLMHFVLRGQVIPNGQLVILIFGPLLLLSVAFRQKAPVRIGKLVPFLLLAMVMVFSMLWNNLSFWGYKASLIPILVAVMVYLAVPGIREMKMLISMFLVFMVINNIVAGLQYAGFDQFYLSARELELKEAGSFKRGIGLVGHFWLTGLVSAASLPMIVMGHAEEKNRLRKLLWIVFLISAIGGLMFSTLRAGFGGAVVGTTVALFLWGKSKAILNLAGIAVLIGILIFTLPIFKQSSSAMLEHATTSDASSAGRPVAAAMAMRLWDESPIFGVGSKGFSRRYMGGKGGNAHNTYVAQLSDYGLLGLGVFLVILIKPFFSLRRGIRRFPEHRGLFLGLAGTLVSIYIVAIVHSVEDATQFWMFPALALAVDRFRDKVVSKPGLAAAANIASLRTS